MKNLRAGYFPVLLCPVSRFCVLARIVKQYFVPAAASFQNFGGFARFDRVDNSSVGM